MIVLILFVPTLFSVLWMIWSLAEMRPARKTMTTFFILGLGVPLYPVLTALLLALIWLVIGCVVLILSIFVPAALAYFFMEGFCKFTGDTVSEQITRALRMQRRGQVVEDITCLELACGLLVGVLSLCSFGMLALVPTILKASFHLSCSSCTLRSVAGWCWSIAVGGPGARRARNLTRFKLGLSFEPCRTWCGKDIQHWIYRTLVSLLTICMM